MGDGNSGHARINLYQQKFVNPTPNTTIYYPLVAGVNLRKYGNCMYRDVSHPLRNFYPNEEYTDLATEKDCVDWCEGKKNKCLYMITNQEQVLLAREDATEPPRSLTSPIWEPTTRTECS